MTKAAKPTKQTPKKASAKPTALDLKARKVKTGVRAGKLERHQK